MAVWKSDMPLIKVDMPLIKIDMPFIKKIFKITVIFQN
jgi:hypothetical protein